MTNLYKRAGSHNYSDPTAWSLTSGGASAGVVPTAADDVFLDANSGQLTIDGTTGSPSIARDFNCTGFTGTLVHANNTVISIFGSLTLNATMTLTEGSTNALWLFSAASTGKTVESAGKTLRVVRFSGNGGGWTLTSQLIFNVLDVEEGTFNTANFSLAGITNSSFTSTSSLVRTINLGTSSVVIGSATFTNTATMTLSAASSTWNTNAGSNNGFSLQCDGAFSFGTLNNCTAWNAPLATVDVYSVGRHSSGARGTTVLSSDLTVQTEFVVVGYQSNQGNRCWVRSNDASIMRTITCNGTVSNCRSCDFDGIIGAGSATWDLSAVTGYSGTTGNNSGITFTAAGTLYYVAGANATDSWYTDANWRSSSGGAAFGRSPLIQDQTYFDANSASASGKTVNFPDRWSAVDASGLAFPMTFATGNMELYGDVLFGPNVITTGTSTLTFRNYGAKTYNENGATVTTYSFNVNNPAGTIAISLVTSGIRASNGSITVTAGTATINAGRFNALTHSGGTLNFGGNVTINSLNSSNTAVRTLNLGSATIELASTGNIWSTNTVTNLTFNCGTSTIYISNTSATSKTLTGGGLTFYDIDVAGASGAGTVSFNGSNGYNQMDLAPLANVRFQNGTIHTIAVPPGWFGTAGNLITIASSSGAANTTVSVPAGTVNCDYLNLTRVTASGNTPFYAGANSTNGGNNTNWLFEAAPTTSTGTVNITQDSNAVTAAGRVPVIAASSILQDGNTLSGAAVAPARGAFNALQADQTLVATAQSPVRGAAAVIQADQTVLASGISPITATVALNQDDQTLTALAFRHIYATLTATQDDNTVAAVGLTGAFRDAVRLAGFVLQEVSLDAVAPTAVEITGTAQEKVDLIGYQVS